MWHLSAANVINDGPLLHVTLHLAPFLLHRQSKVVAVPHDVGHPLSRREVRFIEIVRFFFFFFWLLNQLVNWCFEPSQPLGIISGLKETFIRRYTLERSNKREIRPEELSQKAEDCRENIWNEMLLKGP